jgi:hypothetical protein
MLNQTHNPKVVGSNPSPATKHIKDLWLFAVSPFFVIANLLLTPGEKTGFSRYKSASRVLE